MDNDGHRTFIERRQNDRRGNPVTLEDIENHFAMRLDSQDKVLEELRGMLTVRNSQDDDLRPTLHEIVLLWRASKIAIPTLVMLVGAIWALAAWAKDHIKL